MQKLEKMRENSNMSLYSVNSLVDHKLPDNKLLNQSLKPKLSRSPLLPLPINE